MATISKFPVNKYNFIRWHAVFGATFPLITAARLVDENGLIAADYAGNQLVDYASGSGLNIQDPDAVSPWLPNAYSWPAGEEFYHPLFVVGEAVAFYLNFETDLTGFRCAFIPAKQQDQLYEIVAASYTNTSSYQAFTVPAMPSGRYNMVFIDAVGNIVSMSNAIDVLQPGEWDVQYTMQISWSHNRNMYNYLFKTNNKAPYKLRLHMNQVDWQPAGEFKQYVEASTGLRRNTYTRQEKVVTVETWNFDEPAHEAFMILALCDTIHLQGRRYMPRANYRIETNKDCSLSNGTIELIDVELTQANIHCNC